MRGSGISGFRCASAAGLVALATLVASAAWTAPPARRLTPSVAAPSYNREILPILAEHCFACHGPDAAARKAGLRLDRREEAVSRGAIVPGRPEASRLVVRIFAAEPARRMPPPGPHRPLAESEKRLLRRWIAAGAPYEPHWAFVPLPARVPVPVPKDPAWRGHPIDRFVRVRLEREGLRPSPPASRLEWLRRVTLDLTGLPPTPEEADAFLTDTSPRARENVVERLLASPRYGERMAVPWLDLARYADSYGYQSDQLAPNWPYRDWVVRAFNANMPYDMFITWQLAGDLLPNASREQRLATAFNRLHRMTNEGGSVAEEWRLEGVADRVNTFGTAILGLTLECARCHDHKYDPITQREYYALSAFFNSIDEYGLYDRADIVPTPSLLLPTPEQERALQTARAGAVEAERRLERLVAERETAFREWAARLPASAPADPLPDRIGEFDFEAFEGTLLRNTAPGATQHGARQEEVRLVDGKSGRAVELDGENNVHFPELGRFTRHTPFTLAFWLRDAPEVRRAPGEAVVVFQASSGTDTGPHGYDLLLQDGRLMARLFRHWPGNAIAVRTRATVPKGVWTHVAVTYDGSSRAAGLRIYLDGRPAEVETVRDRLYKGTGEHTLVFGQRFRDRGFRGGRIDTLRIFRRALVPLEIAQLADGRSLTEALARPGGGPESAREALRAYYFSAIDPETRRAAEALARARGQCVAAEDAIFEIAVMEEMPEPRPTWVLARGRYDAPRTDADRVERGTPAALPPFRAPAGAALPRNRLGLARWLTRPDHPLTARVAVNRIWALFFGRGLVETLEDFGLRGARPTHPELLDWLAVEFVRTGWDVKRLVRSIVLSKTYGQASALRPELARRDPENRLLARGPSHRLSAEAIRDLALMASGLLDERRGGPPVSPYQPGDLWREANAMSPPYRQSVGGDLYRRSLYTVWKRTAPMPNMLAFDAVTREVCVARRQTTNTPLQALVLLNDPQFVEAARVLAERSIQEAGADTAARIRLAFRRVATRPVTAEELRLLLALEARQRTLFAADPEAARRLLAIGERKPNPALQPVELAALTVVCQAILNMDAAIWKR